MNLSYKFFFKKRWILSLFLLSLCLFFAFGGDFSDRVACKIYSLSFEKYHSPRSLEFLEDQASLNTGTQETRKIYDCCMFFNEVELLQIRLEELYDYVDHFVIVESQETHRGTPKPLYFLENQHLFEKYLDKIIYVPLTEKLKTSNNPKSWKRENYQRNQVLRGLKGCTDEDIIMISDLDEIPKGEDTPKLIQRLLQCKTPLIFCGHKGFRYFLNRWDPSATPWPGTAITTYQFLKHHSPQWFRRRKDKPWFPLVSSGWHFTTMGGYQKVITKFENVVLHKKDNEAYLKDAERIRREASIQYLVKIDETFPHFIQENQKALKEKGFIDLSSEISLNHVIASWPSYDKLVVQNATTSQEPLEPYVSAKILPFDPSGSFDSSILSFLEQWVKEQNVKTIVDISPGFGLSTQCFALLLSEKGLVYAVDTWAPENMPKDDPRRESSYDYFLSNMKHAHVAHKVIPIKSKNYDGTEIGEIHPDVIYIDCSRFPNTLRQMILEWAPRISPNGIICGLHKEDSSIETDLKEASFQSGLSLYTDGSFWYLKNKKNESRENQ